jgi:hypothetical protein
MANPRFVPRSYCAPPNSFGRDKDVRWRLPDTATESMLDQLGAAQWQHGIVVQMRAALKEDGQTVEDHARTVGVNPERLRSIFRGDILMRVEDWANARRTLTIPRPAVAQPTAVVVSAAVPAVPSAKKS